jgi:hypothetical protein
MISPSQELEGRVLGLAERTNAPLQIPPHSPRAGRRVPGGRPSPASSWFEQLVNEVLAYCSIRSRRKKDWNEVLRIRDITSVPQ